MKRKKLFCGPSPQYCHCPVWDPGASELKVKVVMTIVIVIDVNEPHSYIYIVLGPSEILGPLNCANLVRF